MTNQLNWIASADGTETAEAHGFKYRITPEYIKGEGMTLWLHIPGDRSICGREIQSSIEMSDLKPWAELMSNHIASLLASKAHAALPGWVSVKDRSPEDSRIVEGVWDAVGSVFYCRHLASGWVDAYRDEDVGPTHWREKMPLPTPPNDKPTEGA